MDERDSKPYGVIYCIENTANGKKYIGQTVGSVTKRWKNHISDKSGCRLLKRAFVKYGIESFSIATIAQAKDMDSLNALEVHFIEALETRTRSKGYNLNIGGKSGPQHPETIAKRSEALRGRPLTAAHCEKLSKAQMGHVRSKESREKQSASATGKTRKPHSEESKLRMSAAKIGKSNGPHSAEAKAKMSAAHKGKVLGPMSEEQKQKRSLALIGKTKNWSVEGREKTLAASRAYWAKYRLDKAAQI